MEYFLFKYYIKAYNSDDVTAMLRTMSHTQYYVKNYSFMFQNVSAVCGLGTLGQTITQRSDLL